MTATPATIVQGLDFPECPRWHDGALWFSDMRTGRVMRLDASVRAEVIVEVPGGSGGLGWLPDGRLLIVSMADQRLLSFDGNSLSRSADLTGLATYHCNDLVVDSLGRAYVGSMGFCFDAAYPRFAPGRIMLISPDGTAHVVADDLVFPNGMAISPDGHTLYVAETFGGRITAYDIATDGSLSGRRTWAQLDHVVLPDGSLPADVWHKRRIANYQHGGLVPDGICLDAEGAIWAAVTGSGVVRVAPGGKITERIETSSPAFACCLGGPDGRTLYITCSNWTTGSGRIEAIAVDVAGTGWP